MGLTNNANSNVKYVRVKDGKFFLNTDAETPYDELEGLITGIRFKDEEYNGQTLRKCIFTLTDTSDDTVYQVSFILDSSYLSTLIGFLRNADLAKPLTLCPKIQSYKKENGTDGERRSILVKQNGAFLKGYYSKATGNELPQFEQVKISGKLVYDKTAFLEELERIVNEVFVPTLTTQPVVKMDKPKAEPKVAVQTSTDEGEEVKLPWDE